MAGANERIVGWLLLLTGTALVLSIAWAAIGFLFLGLGLILLQIAERKRKMSQPSSSLDVAQFPSRPMHISEDEPVAAYDAGATVSPDSQQVWPVLAELDPQILRLADALAPFGQRYVDQLAAACFSAGEAKQFPEIARRIVAVALAEKRQPRRYRQDSSSEERQSPSNQISPKVAGGGTLKQLTPLNSEAAFRLLSQIQALAEQPPQHEDLSDAAIAKAVPIAARDEARAETSGQADSGAEASNPTEKNLRKPLADEDDLQNMAQILDRLNEVVKTKPGP